MARPSKPAGVIRMEGRSHRTKAEMAIRERGEASLLTGRKIREAEEVKHNPNAHNEFRRVIKLLDSIEKNDALYEAPINRYCMLRAEEIDLITLKSVYMQQLSDMSEKLSDYINRGEADIKDLYDLQAKMQANVLQIDNRLTSKRKELLTIEKEHAMTVAAALRVIPKAPDTQKSALMEALGG